MSLTSDWYTFSSFSDLGDHLAIWTSPSNAQLSDDVRASNGKSGLPAGPGVPYIFNTLQCLSITPKSELIGSKILGVEVSAEGYSSGSSTSTYVQLVVGGSAVGTPVYYTTGWNTSSDAIALFGGATELYGVSSIDRSQMDSSFGVNFSVTALTVGGGPTYTAAVYLDQIKIRFYYEQRGILGVL